MYDVRLNEDGTLRSYRRVAEDDAAEGVRWYAYLESATDDPWFNDHPYADLLDPAAVRAFMDVTHEAYAASAGAEFGKTIPAVLWRSFFTIPAR